MFALYVDVHVHAVAVMHVDALQYLHAHVTGVMHVDASTVSAHACHRRWYATCACMRIWMWM
jgi:hypothetical protein